jgi:hypothetical protein
VTSAPDLLHKRNDSQTAQADAGVEREPNFLERALRFIWEPAEKIIRAFIRPGYFALALALAVAACVMTEPTPPTPPTPPAPARSASCQRPPDPNLRPDLPSDYIDPCGHPIWPDTPGGFAGAPLSVTLPADTMLDRFGGNNGNFLSPVGAPFAARSIPYVCKGYRYTEYRVAQPLQVKIGPAAPWFGEPGYAVQVQTDKTVQDLLDAHIIAPAGDNPAPPC